MLGPGLSALGEGPVGRGLFTSETSDPNWRKAHNILLPAFSMDAMRGYYPLMLDIAVQLMQKWERLNPDDTVDVPADMTRLTLDTIALCGFDYRFNSFYRDTPTPSWSPCWASLEAAQAQSARAADPAHASTAGAARRAPDATRSSWSQTVQRIIEERRASGALGTVNDLLDRMLTGVDRQSGEKLDDTQHHRPVHHLPDRRPRDHQRPAVVRALCPAQEPRRAGAGLRRGGPRAGHRPERAAHLRPDPPAAVRRPDPRRDAAAVAHGAGVHAPPV